MLVWSADFQPCDDAFFLERKLKGWSKRKKEAVMAEDWNRLQALSKSRARAVEATHASRSGAE